MLSPAAHLSCLQLSPDLAAIVMTYPWECIECKSCAICTKSDNEVWNWLDNETPYM